MSSVVSDFFEGENWLVVTLHVGRQSEDIILHDFNNGGFHSCYHLDTSVVIFNDFADQVCFLHLYLFLL